jgi:hypothetical protein
MRTACRSLRTLLLTWLESHADDFYTPHDQYEALNDLIETAQVYQPHLTKVYTAATLLHAKFKRIENLVRRYEQFLYLFANLYSQRKHGFASLRTKYIG